MHYKKSRKAILLLCSVLSMQAFTYNTVLADKKNVIIDHGPTTEEETTTVIEEIPVEEETPIATEEVPTTIEQPTTELSEEQIKQFQEMKLNEVTQAFLNAKNSCYMDGTDMMALTREQAYAVFQERMYPLLTGNNYSTVFYYFRQAFANETRRLRQEVVGQMEYNGWIRRYNIYEGKFDVYVEEVLNYTDESRGKRVGTHHYFILRIDPVTWKIDSIKGEDVFNSVYYSETDGVPLEDKFNQIFGSLQNEFLEQSVSIPDLVAPIVLPEQTILYDGASASNYAQTYWYNYNPVFPTYSGSGGDCANYGSQSVSAGIESRVLDFGPNASNSWYHYSGSLNTGKNWTWTSTSRFFQYVMSGNAATPGLYGQVIDIRHVRPGDIVHIDYTSNGSYDHTIVVTDVENKEGTNNYSNILFSGHTADRLNQPLSDMGYRATYRAVRIFGAVMPYQVMNYWKLQDGSWYYYHEETGDVSRNTWELVQGSWYYFGGDGKYQNGWMEQDGKWYYFREDGTMKSGWHDENGLRYYLANDGSRVSGLMQYRENTYYFDQNGVMAVGEVVIDGQTYVFAEDGSMIK